MSINKSKTYILPLIDYNWSKEEYSYIVNSYLYHKDYTGNTILIVLTIDDSDTFTDLVSKLYELNEYEDSFYKNENEVVLVFTISDYESYIAFENGKYSEFTQKAKNKLIRYHTKINGRQFSMNISAILNKSARLREKLEADLKVQLPENAELTSIINKNDEEYED